MDPNQLLQDLQQLRGQGLTDDLVTAELQKKGYQPEQIQAALEQPAGDDMPAPPGDMPSPPGDMPAPPEGMPAPPEGMSGPPQPASDQGNIYERIEEITESMIDEKWDELLAEVKKIIEWKESVEEKQTKVASDIEKLKEDFKVLHQGVLGKLEDYDTRMRDVGTELKAVGKVFKDVIPEFVENVKELKSVSKGLKK